MVLKQARDQHSKITTHSRYRVAILIWVLCYSSLSCLLTKPWLCAFLLLPHCQCALWEAELLPRPRGGSWLVIAFPLTELDLGWVLECTFGSLNITSQLGGSTEGLPHLKKGPRASTCLLPSFLPLGIAWWVGRPLVHKPVPWWVAKQKAEEKMDLIVSLNHWTPQSWSQLTKQLLDSLSCKL